MISKIAEAMHTSLSRSAVRIPRQNSNVFAMFDQKQIAEFKEAFSFIDQNGDGFVDRRDLMEILSSLGHPPSSIESEVHALMKDFPEGCTESINFTLFLAMMGDAMQDLDSTEHLTASLKILDESRTGRISVNDLCRHLTQTGADPLSMDEFDVLIRSVEVVDGFVECRQLVDVLTMISE